MMTGPRAYAAKRTWDGGGADANWSTAANWNGDTNVPDGDEAIFGAAFTSGTAIGLNGNQTIKAVTFNSATEFSINNNTLTLTSGDITRSATTGTTTINSNVALGGDAEWDIAGSLIVNGVVSGSRTMKKKGPGDLTLAGANTYTKETTVETGTLTVLNNLGLGSTDSGTVIASGASLQLAGGIAVGRESLTLTGTGISNGGALRNLSGNNNWAGNITMANKTAVHRINSDSGTLTISGNITETGDSNNKDLTFGGAGNIAVTGNIIIAGTNDMRVFKDGTGTTILSGANNHDGITTINGGTLIAASSSALGATGAGTIVNSGTLGLQNNITIGSEALTLNGNGAGDAGALRNISGNNTYQGIITLASESRINSDSGTLALANTGTIGGNFQLAIGGAGNTTISSIIGIGANNLIKDGDGTLTLNGTTVNTFTGNVVANAGTTILSNTASNGNISGGLIVGDGTGTDTVRIAVSDQIGNNSPITINSSGILVADPAVLDTVGAITMTGGTIATGTGTIFASGDITTNSHTSSANIAGLLNINANGNANPSAIRNFNIADGAAAQDLVVSARIADGGIVKNGAGTMTVTGANTYGGGTTVTAGTLLVNNTSGSGTGSGALVINTSATLGGTGSISGNTTINGTHEAGNLGIGNQTFSGGLTYNAGSIFGWELDSPADDLGLNNEGSYDQVTSNTLTGDGSIFQVLLVGGRSFSDPFWGTDNTWTNIFAAGNAYNLENIFSGGFSGDADSLGNVAGRGRFSFSGNTLNWTAVPEPSTAIITAVLAAAGLLRRKRTISVSPAPNHRH